MRSYAKASILAALILAAPATAMAAPPAAKSKIAPGMQVVDVAGNPVGKIHSVRGAELILKTDRHEVRLPVKSFTPDKGKLVFGMSRDALNRATDAMLAQSILPGAAVHGKNGAVVGHIAAIDEKLVTVKLQSGEEIRMPRDAIAPSSDGAVLGITVAELRKMVEQVQPQTP